MRTQPLGRSLTPLADESMSGFVLRLSHRLRVPPGRLAVLTGLVDGTAGSCVRIPAHRMLTLDPATAAVFATTTRLTADEVAQLCLDRYADRYPPLNLDTCRQPSGSFRITPLTVRGWILLDSTRYCPQCLAGDASPIQQRHGGPWQQQWRLRAVFACTVHRRILNHLCPQCGAPAGAAQQYSNIRLVARPADASLHPTQCRGPAEPGHAAESAPACAARLDHTIARTAPVDADLLALQDRILQRLQPGGPVHHDDAAQFFNLLQLVHTLVMLTWPLARDLAGPPAFADAADDYVAQVRHAITQLKQAASPNAVNAPLRKLPTQPEPCAALLHAADSIVNWGNLEEFTERINPLAEHAAQTQPRAWYWLRTQDAWPQPIRQSLVKQVRGFIVPARAGRRPPVPPRQCQFAAEHIPQKLPDAWCVQYLPTANGIATVHLRRAMALKLVELASGRAWSDGAELLGFPRKLAEHAVFHTRRWMRDTSHQDSFDLASEALAQHLDATPNLINYARRRQALRDWTIPTRHWHDFVVALLKQTSTGRGRRHKLDEHKREVLSVLVWTIITDGEHILAPLVTAAKQDPTDPSRPVSLARSAAEVFYTPRRSPADYHTIRHATGSYADALATHIDVHHTTADFTWEPAPLPQPTPGPPVLTETSR